MYDCVYIYIYIYICTTSGVGPLEAAECHVDLLGAPYLRPISLLTLPLPTLPDSNFRGNPLWAWEFNPLKLRLCFDSNPLKSTMLAGTLGVFRGPHFQIYRDLRAFLLPGTPSRTVFPTEE